MTGGTPPPWETASWNREHVVTPDGVMVADFAKPATRAEGEANAALTVRAVNAHADMAAALRSVADEIAERLPADFVTDDTWNPDAPVEMSLTVAECRRVATALAQSTPAPEARS